MPWCDAASIILPPAIGDYFPVQIVAIQPAKPFYLASGECFGEMGYDSVYECLCLDTMKDLFLFNVIGTSGAFFIIQYMLYFC